MGVVADLAQSGLQMAGYEETGKAVDAMGNIFSGVMTGFSIGGPAGAVVGGAAGLGLWTGGETIGRCMDYFTETSMEPSTEP